MNATRYVYRLGGFIDEQFLWRIDAGPEVIASVVEKLRLIESRTVPKTFWDMPPYYWPTNWQANMVAYRSTNFDDDGRGPDGQHYFLLHDPEAGRAYVWYKDNF